MPVLPGAGVRISGPQATARGGDRSARDGPARSPARLRVPARGADRDIVRVALDLQRAQPDRTEVPSPPTSGTAFYHHEFDLADLAGFETVLEELPNLKVMPATVDLRAHEREPARLADVHRRP